MKKNAFQTISRANIRILMALSLVFSISSLRAQDPLMDDFIDDLMSKMTLEEKLGQLNLSSGNMGAVLGGGSGLTEHIEKGEIGATGGFTFQDIKSTQEAAQESRLKIPVLIGVDVIHGFHTVFPIPLGLSCTWDTGLIEKSARIAAKEASATGICWTYSPMVDIARDQIGRAHV